jgi:hypothetical protein
MSEVIFERIAPVVTVHDVDADLGRYRQLGFATELDQPAGYGFAERGAVQLHLQSDDPRRCCVGAAERAEADLAAIRFWLEGHSELVERGADPVSWR